LAGPPDSAVLPVGGPADPNLPRDLPAAPDRPPATDVLTATPAGPAAWELTDFKLIQTFQPRLGANGFGVTDTDFTAQLTLPGWRPLGAPLRLAGGVGAHLWAGPSRDDAGRDLGLPGSVYDFYADLGWKPRPAEWLFLDLGVTPGVYSDLRAFHADAFRVRGRGLAILATSERFQVVAGVLYVNRNGPKVVPAGGVVWSPTPDVRYQLVFPQPKVARRVASWGAADGWVYAAGEFGGGTWAYRRADGTDGSLDLNDYRAVAGGELKRADGWLVRAEVGYVFGRELVPRDRPQALPGDTVMMRLALVY
jgi:hypothetical protein